jgi:hypothetical protein
MRAQIDTGEPTASVPGVTHGGVLGARNRAVTARRAQEPKPGLKAHAKLGKASGPAARSREDPSDSRSKMRARQLARLCTGARGTGLP